MQMNRRSPNAYFLGLWVLGQPGVCERRPGWKVCVGMFRSTIRELGRCWCLRKLSFGNLTEGFCLAVLREGEMAAHDVGLEICADVAGAVRYLPEAS